MFIREAASGDLPAITEIYNDAVETTTAIWNEKLVDVADRAAWLAAREARGYPVLVMVDDEDVVLGYATFGDYRAFDGYRYTVEHSVYIRTDQQGRGIGKALMIELIERAREVGAHVMVAAIEAENVGSLALHRRLGFEDAGTLREVGTKFGRWLDLTFLTLQLSDEAPAA